MNAEAIRFEAMRTCISLQEVNFVWWHTSGLKE